MADNDDMGKNRKLWMAGGPNLEVMGFLEGFSKGDRGWRLCEELVTTYRWC